MKSKNRKNAGEQNTSRRAGLMRITLPLLLALLLTATGVFAEEADADGAAEADAAVTAGTQDIVVLPAPPVLGRSARNASDAEYSVLNPPAPEAEPVYNPLTGLDGYREEAVGKRPVAVVVENDPKARPQWGIDDPEKSPDIILEGEMEGGETRTLWFYADMESLPSQVGPIRSARPPYIRFAELFDAIFIHAGMSHSGGSYVGADTVFEQDGNAHINMLTYGEGAGCLFDRDYSRTSMQEHTAFLRGEYVASTVAEFGFRTDADTSRYTNFVFEQPKEEEGPVVVGPDLFALSKYLTDRYQNPSPAPKETADTACSAIDLSFSSITPTKHWGYSAADGMYHTQDYYTDVSRKNILLLFDATYYIVRSNTWGSNPETYTNYEFAGGQAKLAKDGRIQDLTWAVEDGKIVLRDADGEQVELAPGKTWIGWCSSNHGGWVNVTE